jgi:hypothetical protein
MTAVQPWIDPSITNFTPGKRNLSLLAVSRNCTIAAAAALQSVSLPGDVGTL